MHAPSIHCECCLSMICILCCTCTWYLPTIHVNIILVLNQPFRFHVTDTVLIDTVYIYRNLYSVYLLRRTNAVSRNNRRSECGPACHECGFRTERRAQNDDVYSIEPILRLDLHVPRIQAAIMAKAKRIVVREVC